MSKITDLEQYPQCRDNSTSCEENKQRFEITNTTKEDRQQLVRIKIDGCIYADKDQVKRCDYLFQFGNTFSCFVELKGSKINDAIEQLECSLRNIPVQGKKHAFVVSSKNSLPDAKTSNQRQEQRFKKDYNASLKIKNNLISKPIEKLK